jgi:hypothetical protein
MWFGVASGQLSEHPAPTGGPQLSSTRGPVIPPPPCPICTAPDPRVTPDTASAILWFTCGPCGHIWCAFPPEHLAGFPLADRWDMGDPILPTTREICGGPTTREIVERRPDPADSTFDAHAATTNAPRASGAITLSNQSPIPNRSKWRRRPMAAGPPRASMPAQRLTRARSRWFEQWVELLGAARPYRCQSCQ